MSPPGPVPKRDSQRRRRNAPSGPAATSAPAGAAVVWPAPDPGWHALAVDWYRSLAASGQSAFYEPSDVAKAQVGAAALSQLLLAPRPSARMLSGWQTLAANLLASEGDRRRVRLELQRPAAVDPDEQAAVAAMDGYRLRLGGRPVAGR